MIPVNQTGRRIASVGGAPLVAVSLVAIAVALVAVVGSNLQTSADMRKESQEAYFLGEMQIAVTAVEQSVAAWQSDPDQFSHPAENPRVAEAIDDFARRAQQLSALIDVDELTVVAGFESAFADYVEAVVSLSSDAQQRDLLSLDLLDLGVRAPLLDLLQEESEHLLDSVVADRSSEQLLRWGLPVLLALALAGLFLVVRLQSRSRQLDEQRRASEMRMKFIASVSHEVRTPLTPVVAYAHELRDRIDRYSHDEIVEFADVIARESDEVSAIVEDLLVAARLQFDAIALAPEVLDISEQVSLALETLRVNSSIDVAARGSVLADGGRLRQILRNIVANAQRHGGDVIRVTSERDANDVVIVVADSGPGIPEDMQERVFEPFATARDESGVTASMGLGLSVSRSLATRMGGSLTYSWEDGWSRLSLRLPAATEV